MPTSVFINEFHYDNVNTDSGEAIEIAGIPGTDLTGWTIVLYNGGTTAAAAAAAVTYGTVQTLSGVLVDNGSGLGTMMVTYAQDGLQNGSPDGFALVNAQGQVVQFLSYEGVLTAANGPAAGMTSTDVIQQESNATPVGTSLQLTGSGSYYEDFTWAPTAASTYNKINNGQTYTAPTGTGTPTPSATLSIAAVTASANEGAPGDNTPFTFTVTRSDGTGTASVHYAVTGAATNGANTADFGGLLPSGTVSFADGETQKTITVIVTGDHLAENDEGFVVTLSNPQNAAIATGSASATILNDDHAGALSIANASVLEGNSGSTDLHFTVTRAGGSDGQVSATYTVNLNGTATADDLTGATTGTVTFADGATTADVVVHVQGDTAYEPDETFGITLSAPTGGATIAQATATGTILNDDAPPAAGAISIADASIVEGNSGIQSMEFVLTRDSGSTGAITVDYSLALGTASAADLDPNQAYSGTITFAAGQTTATLLVGIVGDTTIEPNETFTVNLSNATGGAVITDAQAVGTIVDNDPTSVVFINELHYDNVGTDIGEAIELAGPAGTDLTGWTLVLYNGGSGLAYSTRTLSGVIPDQDHGYGTMTFAYASNGIQNGSPSGMALVDASGHVVQFLSYEGTMTAKDGAAKDMTSTDIGVSETSVTNGYSLQLSGTGSNYGDFTWQNAAQNTFGTMPAAGSGGTGAINTGQSFLPATGTSYFGVTDTKINEGNSGVTPLTFTVTRAGGSAAAASVDYHIDLGTVSLDDITATPLSGTLTFGVGEVAKTITIGVIGDTVGENNETLSLTLSNPVGDAQINQATATGTILNDDPIELAIYQIQGAAHTSPVVGQTVSTTGIVTAVSGTSFWIQDPTSHRETGASDAIQVFVGSAPTVAVGDAVQVSGVVTEFQPAAGSLTVTEINTPTVTVVSHDNALPAAIVIGVDGILPPTNVIDDDGMTSYDPQHDGIDFYESLEGMLVTVETPIVVGPTDGKNTYVVASAGEGATNMNDRGGITLSGTDAAPERIEIYADNTVLPGYVPNHTLGDILNNVTGILTYYNSPELLPTQAVTTLVDKETTQEVTALKGDADHLSIASFNMENADPTDPQAKFDAIGKEVVNNLGSPDIIGAQEIQDADGAGSGSDLSGAATAQKVIDAIVAAGGPTYVYVEIAPTVAGSTGGEPGGNIRNGFFYNPERVTYVEGSAELVPGAAFTGSRSPLAAEFQFNGQTVTVIDVHSTSRGGSESAWGADQPATQAGDSSRTAQAEAIKAYTDALQAADPSTKMVILGDFNGYYYENALSTFTKDGSFTNLYSLLPEEERYSYLYEGASQAFDNILVSNNLTNGAAFDAVHVNAEQTVQVITDHDQVVATIYLPTATTTPTNTAPTDITLTNASVAENLPAGTVVGTAAAVDAEGGAMVYALTDNAKGLFAIDAATGVITTTAALDHEALASANITISATDSGGLSFTKTIAILVSDVNEAPARVTISNATVVENSVGGTVIGTLDGHDPDAGSTLTYALATADSRFVIEGNTLLVAAGANIDYEAQHSISLDITATDQGGLHTTSTITLAVQDVAESFGGTSGSDTILGDAGNNVIDAGAGDDVVSPGLGVDTITLGAGADTVRGLLAELLGDTITDFGKEDRIQIQNSDFHRSDFTVSGTGASTTLGFGGGSMALTGGLSGGDVMVAHSGNDTVVTFHAYLAALTENTAVSSSAINGITNQAYLSGDTSTAFTVNVEAMSGAAYHNTVGVYEVDTATGQISDVRIIAADAKNAASAISVTGVEAGHQLGFFLVQDGASTLGSALSSTNLSIVSQNGHLALANNGTAISGATTFFSTSAAANVDGMQHVLSGVASDGSGTIRIGFEDLLRSGSQSDDDFQDVVLHVTAVPQAHAAALETAVLHG
ncbi:Calx-beta domain-containing protein [Novosphingobium terrae]|uniref:Calx-beta domain-containing protein n=1 Tax=Novosphingobium terrae TaxID=2726189 RepID=UPI0019821BB4|nr:Calx-beta domain-containing protein [Novosphingobium terrae]